MPKKKKVTKTTKVAKTVKESKVKETNSILPRKVDKSIVLLLLFILVGLLYIVAKGLQGPGYEQETLRINEVPNNQMTIPTTIVMPGR